MSSGRWGATEMTQMEKSAIMQYVRRPASSSDVGKAVGLTEKQTRDAIYRGLRKLGLSRRTDLLKAWRTLLQRGV